MGNNLQLCISRDKAAEPAHSLPTKDAVDRMTYHGKDMNVIEISIDDTNAVDQNTTVTSEVENLQGNHVPHRPLPEIPKATPGAVVVKALFDYAKQADDDLEFKKGDRMEVVTESDKLEVELWWQARHLQTGQEGYIPSNYVVKDTDSLEAQDWWFAYERRDSDKALLLPGNPIGTFLVRPAADKKTHALSIRDFDNKTQDVIIKHYRIKNLDNGGVYIAPKRTFSTINELINHYSVESDGLCQRLVQPCPREPPVISFRELEINRNGVKLIKELGAGNFGKVYKGKWKTVDIAVKTLKPGSMSTEDFLQEAKIMHTLRHKNLVQLFAVCTQEEPIYIITELMSNGSLLEYLRNDTEEKLTLDIIIDMSVQITDGMAYLEMMEFVHRDLRAANILVGDNNTVKVADFGLARLTKGDDGEENAYLANQDTKFPIKWTAPEAAYERKFTTKSDVWSMGILLYEMVTFGRIPYAGMSAKTVLDQIDHGYRMPKPAAVRFECPNGLYEMMLKCWDKKPENRPTFEYLHSFFDDFLGSTAGIYK